MVLAIVAAQIVATSLAFAGGPVDFAFESDGPTLAQATGVRIRTADLANSNDHEEYLRQLDGAAQLGVKVVYLTAPWDPDPVWRSDRLVAFERNVLAAKTRGLRPIINVGTWNRNGDPANPWYPYWPRDEAQRASLVAYVLEIFRLSQGAEVVVSNEPNREAVSEEDLRDYCRNLIAVSTAKRAAGIPGKLVGFSGSTNDRGDSLKGPTGARMQAIDIRRFHAVATEMSLYEHLDAVSVHVYPPSGIFNGYGPEQKLLNAGSREPTPPRTRTRQIRVVEPVLAPILIKARQLGLPVLVLETGAPSVFTSERDQASLVLRGLLSSLAAGATTCSIYEFSDSPPTNDAEDEFGLLRHDGSEKPAGTALRQLLAVLGSHRFESWSYDGNDHFTVTFVNGSSTKSVRWSSTEASATPTYPYIPSVSD